MRASLALLLAVTAASARPARAEPPDVPDQTGLVLALRAGGGVAFGSLESGGVPVRDVVQWKVPLWLEVGYRFNPHVRGELYFEYGPGSVASAYCSPGVTCSAADARFGLAVQLHLAPERLVDPWIGVGFGVEVLNAHLSDAVPLGAAGRHEFTWAGIELPVEVGLDVAVSERFTVGPYVSAAFGQFTSISQGPVGEDRESGAIDRRSTHGWVQVGIKTTLKL